MKQIAQRYSTGEVSLLDVAEPSTRPGGVVVRTEFSLISTGTEMQKVGEAKLNLIGKARARPDQVRKVLDSVTQQGISPTIRKVRTQLEDYTPLGYSLVGRIVDVGEGVSDLQVGQRVACAGNQFATHAELNWVPRNLCVAVPEDVSPRSAAFTTVGSIALQAVRQSEAALGEMACVIGLGLVGQLVVQLLHSAGVNVVGIDTRADRCKIAEASGALAAGAPTGDDLGRIEEVVRRLTDGAGADHVFLAASTDSSQPVELAADLSRDRARVVDIANCRLDLPWKAYYEKELELRFSRSYGPGRYDPRYEEEGVDYPIGYVRWTEERNMKAFVRLLADGRMDCEPLIGRVFPFEEAVRAYEGMHSGEVEGIAILFEYDVSESTVDERIAVRPDPAPAAARPATGPTVRLGVVGAGNYATSMLLPHLAGRDDVDLVRVATSTTLSGATAKERFGFSSAVTSAADVIASPHVDAVVIATRHDSHAGLTIDALDAGKPVFVEKPLAVNADELADVVDALTRSEQRLMVGYNRRFSPALVAMRSAWGSTEGAVVAHYDVNAGRLDPSSWYGDETRQGTRFVGEGGHFIDTLSWWIGEDPTEVFAVAGPDGGMECTLRYPSGSVGRLSYATGGNSRYPKETMTVFGRGRTARLDNFRQAAVWTGRRKKVVYRSVLQTDKGQSGLLDALVSSLLDGEPAPVAPASLVATSLATFAAERSAVAGELVPVSLEAVR